MPKSAFVTGGSGFLGTNLIRALINENWSVTALHRSSSNLKYIKDLPIQLVEGSITDKSSLQNAIPKNTEVVFHIAGDTNMWSKNNARQTAINVDGTRNILEVSVEKGVSTFIHTSSISTWGAATGLIDETTPQQAENSWINYEKTKWQGEQEALKGMEKGLKVVIINPGSIVGRYDNNTWASMFFALRDGNVPGVPPGNNSFVHVNDVVQAMILSVDKGQNGHNYLITGENTSIQAFATEVAKQMGLHKTPPNIPVFILKILAKIGTVTAFFTGKEPTMTPEIVEFMSRKDLAYDNSKALREFGYRMTPWQNGVKECYEWLKEEGLL